MNQTLRLVTRVAMFSLIVLIVMGGATSCKSKKKLAAEQAAAERATKVEQATKDLNAIINRETTWTPDQQQQRVNTIKSWKLDNPEINALITMAETEIANQRAEIQRKAEEERLRQQEMEKNAAQKSKFASLESQLVAIAGAGNFDASNAQINKTIQLFASPDVPVLIIVSQEGGITDYDKPTTASRFLNFLKDTRQFKYDIYNVKKDSNGLITELELITK